MGFVMGFDRVGRTDVAEVGGKGANLGELSRVEGVPVPAGFCVTTSAFRLVLAQVPAIEEHLDRLASAALRQAIEDAPVPAELVGEIEAALAELGPPTAAYAVRSSATAEDLPTASFAGQQDSFLNVVGPAEVLRHVRRCWASLFTERAVAYRQRNGFDHRAVSMAVVVQRMVDADAAGVMFTADPVTSNRKVVTVEAAPGLGEALVSGLVNADVYRVRDGELVEPVGEPSTLTTEHVVRIARLGRRIEAYFGQPQDVEWCRAGAEFFVVQSRPITTLFPIPTTDDGASHVFVSVGHQQMMTDAMKPLGISVWQLTAPTPMYEAGGRLFVDVAPRLATEDGRDGLMRMLGRSDPLMGDALRTLLESRDFDRPQPADASAAPGGGGEPALLDTDPAIVTELIEQTDASVAKIAGALEAASGTAVFDLIEADLEERKRHVFDPRSLQAVMASVEATWWLNEHLEQWLGEKNAADVLAQSVPHNVTSEMGLALLDVADVIRPHAAVVAFLQDVADADPDGAAFLDELAALPGGPEVRDAIGAFLERYGMRCAGEIDVTRTRWSERPAMLLPAVLGHVRNFEPGESRRRFARGLQEYRSTKLQLVARLRELPDGEDKVEQTLRMIERLRTFAGYREYPKYGMVGRYYAYKRALLREADRLVDAGALRAREDVFYLRFDEFREAVRTGTVDYGPIERRRSEFRSYETLAAPRLITSDGEALSGHHRRDDLPPGALAGTPVSAGVVEGRARVVTDIAQADLEPGDVLVTAYTDPSWTPLFVSVAALVTEVGGQMTHGAVIAREYGLPAVVAVEQATRRIRDGQRIRVNGSDGYVELLD